MGLLCDYMQHNVSERYFMFQNVFCLDSRQLAVVEGTTVVIFSAFKPLEALSHPKLACPLKDHPEKSLINAQSLNTAPTQGQHLRHPTRCPTQAAPRLAREEGKEAGSGAGAWVRISPAVRPQAGPFTSRFLRFFLCKVGMMVTPTSQEVLKIK